MFVRNTSFSMLNVLCIEADNQRNLGGSCQRDLVYMNSYLNQLRLPYRQRTLLSIDSSFALPDFDGHDLSEYKRVFEQFHTGVHSADVVVVCVSGHGYRMKATDDTTESDGLDEYIRYSNGRIMDNEFWCDLIHPMISKCPRRIVCLADTCHSGSLFDLERAPLSEMLTQVVSLTACTDQQFDSCDMSSVGYGGSLTVHLLEISQSLHTLCFGSLADIQSIVDRLTVILKALRQTPVLMWT